MFKKQDHFKWITMPALTLVIISLAVFIYASIGNNDILISEALEKGMYNEGIKWFIAIYNQIGFSEIIIAIFFFVVLMIENFIVYKKEKKKDSWIKRNHQLVWIIYATFFIIWTIYNLISITKYMNINSGFGVGNDPTMLGSYRYRQIGRIVAYLIQTSVWIFISLYIRLKLVKQENFLSKQLWISSIKCLVSFTIIYLIIIILKPLMARPYYYNYKFNDIYNYLTNDLGWIYEESLNFVYGWSIDGSEHIYNVDFYPWWKPYGFDERLTNNTSGLVITDFAFPSGHIGAIFVVGSSFFYVFNNRQKPLNNWIKTFIIIWIIHLLIMNFVVIIFRFHWMTDTTFSILYSIAAIYLANLIVIKIIDKVKKTHQNQHLRTNC